MREPLLCLQLRMPAEASACSRGFTGHTAAGRHATPFCRASCPKEDALAPAAAATTAGAVVASSAAVLLSAGCLTKQRRTRRRQQRAMAVGCRATTVTRVEATPSFEIVQIPGNKGLGAVATRNINAGELVLAEKPLVSIGASQEDRWKALLRNQFAEVNAGLRNALMELYGASTVNTQKTFEGAMESYRVPRTANEVRGTTVVCAKLSYFNHSCNPNCEQSWYGESSQQRVHASTRICVGEELCIPYTDITAVTADRAAALRTSYGFTCNCPTCDTAEATPDLRRSRMRLLQRRVEAAVGDSEDSEDAKGAVQMVSELIELYDKELLFTRGLRERASFCAFQLALAAGDVELAKSWAMKSYQFSTLFRGKDHEMTQQLRQFVDDPKSHPAYNRVEVPEGLLENSSVVLSAISLAAFVAWVLQLEF